MGNANILIDPLPESVEIKGADIPIRTDFRFWIMFEQLVLDDSLSDAEKVEAALGLVYAAIPQAVEEAVEAMLWFYSCGAKDEPKRPANGQKRQGASENVKCFDYDIDAGLIFAAFYDQYGIDLAEANLHWWKYRALFDGLRPDHQFCKVVGYRCADLSKIKSKTERKRIAELKAKYALPSAMSLEDKIELAGNVFASGGSK